MYIQISTGPTERFFATLANIRNRACVQRNLRSRGLSIVEALPQSLMVNLKNGLCAAAVPAG